MSRILSLALAPPAPALVFAASLLVAGTGLLQAETWTIHPDGSGDFATIEDALTDPQVSSGDVIELAAGTFTGPGNRDLDTQGKAVTVRAAGALGSAILDLESAGRAFTIRRGEGPESVFERLVVRNGEILEGNGAAMLIDGASPRIVECRFEDNISFAGGGALACRDGAALVIERCSFVDNRALAEPGGAIQFTGLGLLEVHDCSFTSNLSEAQGGAIYCGTGSELIVEDSEFVTNRGEPCGGIYASAGSRVTVLRSQFEGNRDGSGGGAGLGLEGATGTIADCSFNGGVSDAGGATALRVADSDAIVQRCDFRGNGGEFELSGSPIVCVGSGVMLFDHCLVTGNIAWMGESGAFRVIDAAVTIRNCTVTRNQPINFFPESAGGVLAEGTADVTIERSIVYGNCSNLGNDDARAEIGARIAFYCSAVAAANAGGPGTIEFVGTQVAGDPLFCGPELCGTETSIGGDYTLDSSSLCLPCASPCGGLIGALGVGCPAAEAPWDVGRSGRLTLAVTNPVRDAATFRIGADRPGKVSVEIFDVLGRKLRTLETADAERPGPSVLAWDLRDDDGRRVPAGRYLARASLGGDAVQSSFVAVH